MERHGGNRSDLNPAAFGSSYADGVSGTSPVGYGTDPLFNISHALLWQGTAASALDLHPAGFLNSYAIGVSEGIQVGYGTLALSTGEGDAHALFWAGSAASVVDLQPEGFDSSIALGVSGGPSWFGHRFGDGLFSCNLLERYGIQCC